MMREEWRGFLSSGTRTAKLASRRVDGRPHVTPVWFVLDGDDLVFTTQRDTVKGRNIRNARASCCASTTSVRRSRLSRLRARPSRASCRPMPWSNGRRGFRCATHGTRPSRRLQEAQRRRGRALGSRSALEGESAKGHRGLMTPDATASTHAGAHSDHPPSRPSEPSWYGEPCS
jgi:hypothetical protein